jgi:hypothetical protein
LRSIDLGCCFIVVHSWHLHVPQSQDVFAHIWNAHHQPEARPSYEAHQPQYQYYQCLSRSSSILQTKAVLSCIAVQKKCLSCLVSALWMKSFIPRSRLQTYSSLSCVDWPSNCRCIAGPCLSCARGCRRTTTFILHHEPQMIIHFFSFRLPFSHPIAPEADH